MSRTPLKKRRLNRSSIFRVDALEPRLLLTATQLIRNGTFQGTISSSDWVTSGYFQADSRFGNYHSEPGYAYLSDLSGNPANSISGTIYQQLTIPSNSTSLTLTFWTKITTSETTTTSANDTMTAEVMDSTGTNVLQNLTTFSNLNASSSYVQSTFFLNRSLIGQTVRLFFTAATDAQLPTTFRVDDVGLNAVSLTTGLRSVGYFPDGRFSLRNQIDFTAVTHVNYADASLDSSGNFVTSGWLTLSNLDTMVSLLHADGDTVSITVYSSTNVFPTVSASPTARANFATQAVAFCIAHNLDGIDIDWEPPYSNDNPNYGALIDALYAAGHADHLLLTAAVNPLETEIPPATVNAEMDWVNVMCYDFTPSDSSTYTDSVTGINTWANAGVPKSKILMGLPFYGREGTSWSNTTTQVYTNIIPNYYSVFGVYPAPSVDSYTDTNGLTWYFNGVNTIEKKCAYVRDNGFGGVMIWELGEDHWNASNQYDQYSLLPVIKTMMRPPTWLTPASGSQTHLVNQSFFVDAGSVTLNSDVSIANPNLTITVASSASVTMASVEHLAGLTIAGTTTIPAGGADTLVTSALSFSGSGKLDLNDNALIIPYSFTSPLATIRPYLVSGRGAGPGAPATWIGNGIASTYAHTHGNGFNLAIGVVDNAVLASINASGSYTSFAGQTVSSDSILIRMTYGADANLDGKVDGSDVSIIGTHLNQPGSGQWFYGDFDYSGMCDGNDISVLGTTFGATSPALSPAQLAPSSTILAPASTSIVSDTPSTNVEPTLAPPPPPTKENIAAPLVIPQSTDRNPQFSASVFCLQPISLPPQDSLFNKRRPAPISILFSPPTLPIFSNTPQDS